MRIPINNYRITSAFGAKRSYGAHQGVDLVSTSGDDNIYAPEGGTIKSTGFDRSAGNYVNIIVSNREHKLFHNSKILVKAGQQVSEGQVVAIMGGSGFGADGKNYAKHCHWGVKVNGIYVNPMTLNTSQTRPVLRQGATGGHVAYMQARLNAHGFNPGPIDSSFGPRTAAALGAFQRAKRLVPDQICGPLTWGQLG